MLNIIWAMKYGMKIASFGPDCEISVIIWTKNYSKFTD